MNSKLIHNSLQMQLNHNQLAAAAAAAAAAANNPTQQQQSVMNNLLASQQQQQQAQPNASYFALSQHFDQRIWFSLIHAPTLVHSLLLGWHKTTAYYCFRYHSRPFFLFSFLLLFIIIIIIIIFIIIKFWHHSFYYNIILDVFII